MPTRLPQNSITTWPDAESYEDQKTAEFVRENFLPVKAHIKGHPPWFQGFDAVSTPTVLLLDAAGKERV
jgi:hypothetical protein